LCFRRGGKGSVKELVCCNKLDFIYEFVGEAFSLMGRGNMKMRNEELTTPEGNN
jgi:hypothetical protein